MYTMYTCISILFMIIKKTRQLLGFIVRFLNIISTKEYARYYMQSEKIVCVTRFRFGRFLKIGHTCGPILNTVKPVFVYLDKKTPFF